MKPIIMHLWHAACATVLNALAAMGSWLMRNCGRWSNYHEAKRDAL